MFPWFWWHIAPRYEFPLSGNVTQDFLMKEFFSAIKPIAGNGPIEQKAFESASYGKQIGLISELLLSLADSDIVDANKGRVALKQLEKIYRDIETIKHEHISKDIEKAATILEALKSSNPRQFDNVMARLSK